MGIVDKYERRPAGDLPARGALGFIILIGLVSLFADTTYEGARSIAGPYLGMLGASGAVVGFVAGLGELVGYAVRLGSGWLSDRTGRYWAVTGAGYAVNLLAVPLLALAGSWQWAAALLVAERMGRAVRTPARDAMLSHAAHRTGVGWGFGLHEALDQTGAVVGPLAVGAVLYLGYGYREGFALLIVPALCALILLLLAWLQYPHPRDFELVPAALHTRGLQGQLWLYLGGIGLVAAGFIDYPLIALHFQQAGTMPVAWIPAMYAIAMATDGAAALALGAWFDRVGSWALVLGAGVALLAPPLAFFGGSWGAILGMACWGVGMGAQESVMRAVVARMTAPERRGTAFGLFNSVYGVAWFVGSAAIGLAYDRSITLAVAVAVALQAAGVMTLALLSWRDAGKAR
jgi:MFS family permease